MSDRTHDWRARRARDMNYSPDPEVEGPERVVEKVKVYEQPQWHPEEKDCRQSMSRRLNDDK